MSNYLAFDTDDLGADYGRLLETVLDRGDTVRPRGMAVKEVRPLLLRLSRPERCFTKRPGINRALTYMEICQILAGDFDKALFDAISPLASKLLTAGGAYGPRTVDQLPNVASELESDPDTRRAVVYVGRPDDLERIQAAATTDQPCTMTWQFFNRGGRLEMVVNMRSWDLVWGLANDVPCFVAVQQALAWALGLEVGHYTHLAGSAHVYERHWGIVPEVGVSTEELSPLVPAGRVELAETAAGRWENVVCDAVEALQVAELSMIGQRGDSEPPEQWAKALALWERRFGRADG